MLLGWLLGGYFDPSWRVLAFLYVLGFILSAPFALDVLRGRKEPRPAEPEPQAVVHGVPHAPNSTYIVVSPPPPRRAFKVVELGPISLFFYTIFYRAPLALGDQVLTGIWRLLGRIRGEETITYPTMADLEESDEDSTLDQDR
jgi:hypothetical protein